MLHQTFLFLGQLWQLFEVSQILEFLRYFYTKEYAPTGSISFQRIFFFKRGPLRCKNEHKRVASPENVSTDLQERVYTFKADQSDLEVDGDNSAPYSH